jgi:hypothetical protein
MRSRLALAVAATTAALAAVAPATASADAFCSFTFKVTLSPGLAMAPGDATFTSDGETGKVMCFGDVNGKMITGPGTIGVKGSATGASCASGKGTGTSSYTLPTASGPVAVSYTYPFSYTLGAGPFMSPGYSGGFGFLPTKGTCLTPVTEAQVMGFSHIVSPKSGAAHKRLSRRHHRK